MVKVMLGVDAALSFEGAGWKVGAASEEVRQAEKLRSPSPGRLYRRGVASSPAMLGPELFINHRNNEAEFAFRVAHDIPDRPDAYVESELASKIDCLLPVLEIGDMVFEDWYAASGFLGPCMDNGGGAAIVHGDPVYNWRDLDLANARIELRFNGHCLKSGIGAAAMGHPLTSFTWMVNWLREHDRSVKAGEIISTGTCTGHCFATRGDQIVADFGPLGQVSVTYT
jgi:2-keto-4-pentenoate hydratase